MMDAPSRDRLHAVVIAAFEDSGVLERFLARLPGFQVPCSLRFRGVGEGILGRWGVDACAQILIRARWRQVAFLLVLLAVVGLATGILPLQILGVVFDMMALGCVLQAARRRATSGIAGTRRSHVGRGRAPV